jgi:membrane protease YdiL (CAAX protease family)
MKPMRQFLTLIFVWTAASVAAFFYSQQQHISTPLLYALLPAFLLEIGLYVMPGSERARRIFDQLGGKPARAFLLAAGAVTPYLIESAQTRTFKTTAFLMLLGLVLVAAFWYVFLKPGLFPDLLYLGFMGSVYLSSAFRQIYIRPEPHIQVEILGKLMWIRLGIMAVLSLRRLENVRFGFLPASAEWRIGIEQFLYFLPVGALAAHVLRFAQFHPVRLIWWKYLIFIPAIFLGVLWVVALAEEFFFRGFLQQTLARALGSNTAGLVLASALFGSAHLPYRSFANWRLAILAAMAGIFYGLAFLKARSIRASMVTHALVVTVWKSLFAG